MIRKLLILLLILTVNILSSYAQSAQDFAKYKNTDFSKLPDAQIEQINSQMKQRGLTWPQMKAMAKQRGLTDSQLSALEKRIKEVQNKAQTKNTAQTTTATTAKQSVKTAAQNEISEEEAKIFGFDVFNIKNLTFEPSANAPISENYILGPGDEILIDISGNSSMNYDLYVQNSGAIEIPVAGPVYVGGLPFGEARERILQKLSTIMSDLGGGTLASIHTGMLRMINVTLMGEVRLPGTYTLNGGATIFNALYFSGGPSKNGSFRDVQLIRNGKIIAHLDVYDLLIRGKIASKDPLLDGDIILVPPYQKRIVVAGEFKRNGYFEAKEGETVKDIIEFAGGFKANANADAIEVYHIGPKGVSFKSVDSKSNELLINGDSIVAPTLKLDRLDNLVNIDGAVFKPGNYEYIQGMTLKSLVEQAGGLQEDAFPYRGVLTRLKEDHNTLEALNFNVAELRNGAFDMPLQANDSIKIASLADMNERPKVLINGAVHEVGEYNFRVGMTLGDLIVLAGGTTELASNHVSIVRRLDNEIRNKENTSLGQHKSYAISSDLSLNDGASNEPLMPFDVVTVYEYPTASKGGMVEIKGEVLYNGEYSIVSKEETVLQLIERAGGLTPLAYTDGARLYRRVSLSDKERLIKEHIAYTSAPDSSMVNPSQFEDSYELVSLSLNDILSNKKGAKDIFLKDGDEIVIPMEPQTMRVSGEVLNPISLTYVDGDNAKDCVNKAGGFSSKASKKRTYVIMPDGKAKPTTHILFFRHYPKVVPGSEVVVPQKPERMEATTVVSISSSIVSMAAVLIVLFR